MPTMYSELKYGFKNDLNKQNQIGLSKHKKKESINISLAVSPPNFTNVTKITYLQTLIDSSMPAELKKCNEIPKKFACALNFAH